MIAILDCGMGNTGSILNMMRHVGGEARVAADEATILSASGIILPGVGAFDNGMAKLTATGILDPLRQRILRDRVPFLGICLGMHLLFGRSEEGRLSGLGWIPGEVVRFDGAAMRARGLKVPHMGWNRVRPSTDGPLFRGLEQEGRFYFVHAYHARCAEDADVLAVSEYGYPFVSAVRRENVFGVQFHPEKSHRFGMTLLKSFLAMTTC